MYEVRVIILICIIWKRYWKKGEVKSLCLTKHHAMKTYWGSGDIAPRIDLGTKWR